MDREDSIAQWVIDNRYPKSEQEKVSDFEMFDKARVMINRLKEELARERSIGFHRWAYENHYSKYWGSDGPNCDKWYKGYTMPDRTYYTDSELYDLYIESLNK